MNINDIALIVSIESNLNNLNLMTNTIKQHRFYEDEAIKCFKCWRKNGGWLKNIQIYCVCPSKNTLNKNTQNELKKLNVEYIEYYDNNIFNYSSGFLTLPFIQQLFEKKVNINQNILIRIDLDMQLLKPLPIEWFYNVYLGQTCIGQYDIYSIKDQRRIYKNFLPFDTGLMITDKRNMFGSLWYKLCFSDYILNTNEWQAVKKQFGNYYLEEFVVDYIYANNLSRIVPIQRYQYGEGYGSLNTFSDIEFKSLYFLHEHLYINKSSLITSEYNSIIEHIIYNRRNKQNYIDVLSSYNN